MNEPILLFDVMDIYRETKTMLDAIEDPTRNMTPNEKAAYEQWLENEAEEQYQIMMGAEDLTTGCDPYPEY